MEETLLTFYKKYPSAGANCRNSDRVAYMEVIFFKDFVNINQYVQTNANRGFLLHKSIT
jgi:hypothetical protein